MLDVDLAAVYGNETKDFSHMDRIEIKGYKSLKDISLELCPINILIGANGSGKSNFLSFFEFLKNIYIRNLQGYVALNGDMDKYLFEGRKVTDEISAYMCFGKNGYSFTLKAAEEGFVFTKEGLWYSGNPFYSNPVDIASFNRESRLYSETTPRSAFIRNYLGQLEIYHFHDTGSNSPFNKVSNIERDTFALYNKGDNIAAFLYGIREKSLKRYMFIVKTIQSIAPYFRDFHLVPNEQGDLKLFWKDKYSSYIYGVNDLSDGTKRFIALTTLFLQPNLPQTLVIDEPELGLHPAAICKLAGLIRSASQRGCQVIVATQSTDLINFFNAEDIITVDQSGGVSCFTRLKSENLTQWMNEYSLSDLWSRRIISSGQPNPVIQ